MTATKEFRLKFDEYDVGALYVESPSHIATLIFGHGAGAGMRHSTLERISEELANVGISTFRFNFPYMEARKNRTDSKPVASAAFVAALAYAEKNFQGPFFLGGHSFGGRMSSHAVVDHELDVKGLIFGSFPLHNPAKPNLDRAEHMGEIPCPMLFLSGSRDGMADRNLMNRLKRRLGTNAQLKWLETADHGYKVLKRTRKRKDDVFEEFAKHADKFVRSILEG